MTNRPTLDELRRMPRLYATERLPAPEKVIHMHFLFGESDWYAVEFDGEDLFFGFAVLNGDMLNMELGYFSLAELDKIELWGFEVLRDPDWTPVAAGEVEALRGWI